MPGGVAPPRALTGIVSVASSASYPEIARGRVAPLVLHRAHPPAADGQGRLPVLVDLDGTLIACDTLHESLAALLFRHPAALPRVLLALRHGRAAFKRAVCAEVTLSPEAMPIRPELLAWLHRQREAGHALHLVTGADQSIADAVATRLGIFASATGSDGRTNLAGETKARLLRARFPDGFIYAGDSHRDVPVFAASQGVVLVGASSVTAGRVRDLPVPVLAEFPAARAGWIAWLKALRAHQWAKNLLLFVPLVLAHSYGDVAAVARCVAGFGAFALVVSGTYLLNDLSDLEADRLHPAKRRRPTAAGTISVLEGATAAFLLIAVGLGLAVPLGRNFALGVAAYLALTTAYSARLKRVPLLDALVIAGLFTLRVVLGVELARVPYSPWLLSFSAFFFFSLALAKRHVEVMRAGPMGSPSLTRRGYVRDDWPLTLAFGISAGMASLLIMILYVANDVLPAHVYRHPAWLYVAPAAVGIWLCRIWLLANRRELDDDPVVLALRDPPSWAIGSAIAAAFVLAG
jgi:4-hydroxybenzoate polyprenyltransferase/phosphoserine phosphatase